MEVSRISQQSIEIYNRNLAKQADARHSERILEERRNKENSMQHRQGLRNLEDKLHS